MGHTEVCPTVARGPPQIYAQIAPYIFCNRIAKGTSDIFHVGKDILLSGGRNKTFFLSTCVLKLSGL